MFAKECVDTLCECLSFHKNELMVIVAGYEKDLDNSIFKINPGMRSRFLWNFSLHEYNPAELYKIFSIKVERQRKWNLDADILGEKWFTENKSKFIYNGRDMEILLTYVKISHSHRVYGKPESEKYKVCQTDLENGLEMLLQNRKEDTSNKSIHSMYV